MYHVGISQYSPACGSGDSTNSTISKSEFIVKADAICTQYNDTLEEKTSELASDATEEQVLAFVTDVLVPEFGNMRCVGPIDSGSGIDIDSRRVTVCKHQPSTDGLWSHGLRRRLSLSLSITELNLRDGLDGAVGDRCTLSISCNNMINRTG